MSEYLTLGHMTPCDNFPRVKHYFLPHHGVFKNQDPNSSLRVVFDASSKTSTNVSLNDILLSGPKLQNDLCEVILRFRCHSVVFACDIRQMYRQIKIHPDDQHFQLIYWRETPTDLVKVFKLTTVTYGVTSAPFLAIRTLHQLAEDEGAQFPQAARVLKSQTFVDDIIAGADNVQEALTLQHDLTKLLSLGGFQLRKWCSNSDILISHISEDDREIPLSFQYSEQPIYNILGLQWNSTSDEFSYAVKISNVPHTKRSVLSAIARIYDPCGWLAPVVFLAKSFIQYLWTLGLQWDDPLSSNVAFRWEEILKNLARVKEITLPRSLFIERTSSVQLLGFCDASELGYAAVIYLRCASADNNTKIALLMAKSRVAPLKRISLPRLELCGAHLLAKLIHYSSNLVSNYCKMESVTAWCDSTIALSWIRTPPYRLKVFVANRVAQIQEWVPPERWFHVSSQHNPADCASRGLPTPLFAKNSLWWSGPRWLSLPPEDWPCSPFAPLDEDLPEVKQPIFNVCSSTVIPEWDLLFKFSKWSTLQRVVAFIRRFAHNCHRSGSKYGMLSSQELQKATHVICKLIQKISFKEELLLLQKEQPCTKRMQRLSPFIDDEGLLRVGGRLKHADLPHHGKHQILLPKSHHVVNLLIDYYHIKYLHAGPVLLQSILYEQFWILSARSVIRSRIFKCIRCFRCHPRNVPPLMGELPKYRVNPVRPFQKTGMDYAGPFTIRSHALRRTVPLKVYLCLFICMCTKAVHLEVVTDLSSDAFIAALTRFVSRRGLCSDLYSDCGTNFVGASTQLKRTIKNFYSSPETQEAISHFATENCINFHFIPPAAPHQGGLWERAIKSAKTLLIRSIGQTLLTLQEFITLVTKVEAMLNSRPLTPLSTDPADVSALTPGHFLIGTSMTAIPEDDFAALPTNRLSRWQTVQAFSQRIWRRWHQEYHHTLQQRSKWTRRRRNLKVGDLVAVHSPKTPPLQWCLARITKAIPGDDGIVRVVQLRTPKGTLTRPATRVFPLPIDD
ncbi:uncharacterized protein LOC124155646 isoform X2 [Ischnura elegans]|nr:uncharacterized protein LOC124155646 isoform X2 [Ischnura elegans]